MKFEQPKEQKDLEEILRHKVRVAIKVYENPLDDPNLKRYIKTHFLTKGDVQKIIDEEKGKIERERKEIAEKSKYLKRPQK